ncbi:UNKNOWN [Stylonychia lemnae]|uniref:Enkurin domain-containing protein n=1 Tax=Stylonychia lemnae TaxID=5949 RepID=A0A078AQB8_STYLE|nr:UNKNOWN [Stylonychia lemnae]|eukprot:CDW84605.1 UNKNOWN [Stylonychia lemnae]
MRQKEMELQHKYDEERNRPQKQEWKMKKFLSVDSKISQIVIILALIQTIEAFSLIIHFADQKEFETSSKQSRQNVGGSILAGNQIAMAVNTPKIENYEIPKGKVYEHLYQSSSQPIQPKDYQQTPMNVPQSTKLGGQKAKQQFEESIFALAGNDQVFNSNRPNYQQQQQQNELLPQMMDMKQQYQNQSRQQNNINSYQDNSYNYNNNASQMGMNNYGGNNNNNQNSQKYLNQIINDSHSINSKPLSNQNDRRNYGKNYISENKNKVIHEQPKSKILDPNSNSPNLHKSFGKVPKYINRFQKQKEDEYYDRIREEEEARIPPGTRQMSEEERQRTLVELDQSKKEVNILLEKLPIGSNTLTMQRRKKELEEKLLRIDRAIETFSKKTVYIAL